MSQVAIIDTGLANTASLGAAIRRAGGEPFITEETIVVRKTDFAVLPGVGSFGNGMKALTSRGLDISIKERIAANKPTLCICLGMQLLFEGSEESPNTQGLGILSGQVTHFPPHVRSPQFGWNKVNVEADSQFLETGYAYFANSYRATGFIENCSTALAQHGGSFIAAVEKECMLACQFHPELSGKWGQGILERWLSKC